MHKMWIRHRSGDHERGTEIREESLTTRAHVSPTKEPDKTTNIRKGVTQIIEITQPLEAKEGVALSVVELNADNWEKEVLQSETLVLVDFWHDRCPWCLRLNPIFDEVATEYHGKTKFVKLNILAKPENQQIAVMYGVMGTPTLIFFCDGRPVETLVGFQPKDRLKQTLEDMIAKHQECIQQSTKL